jgi:hypothetical protein
MAAVLDSNAGPHRRRLFRYNEVPVDHEFHKASAVTKVKRYSQQPQSMQE